ncbi:706_t:CDS:2, partial [Gigaspora margarita]
MSCGHPSSNICTNHFYPAEKNNTNANSLSTLHQICKYCNKDVIDLVDWLKEHLNKYNFFSFELRESMDLITNKCVSQSITNFLNSMPHNNKANKYLDDAYSQEHEYLEDKLKKVNYISLISDG